MSIDARTKPASVAHTAPSFNSSTALSMVVPGSANLSLATWTHTASTLGQVMHTPPGEAKPTITAASQANTMGGLLSSIPPEKQRFDIDHEKRGEQAKQLIFVSSALVSTIMKPRHAAKISSFG